MNQLNIELLDKVRESRLAALAGNEVFELPEKVLQFGTGVLLRGLPDYFIDKANRNGIFNGRIVVVKSTNTGGADAFATQNGLYTHVVRGIENGIQAEEIIINTSISRVLTASEQWDEILACARNPEMQLIISNTTEVGLTLQEDDNIKAIPPKSFPGKLIAFLKERFDAFEGSAESGMVIVPTELIPNNGNLLRVIVLKLAEINGSNEDFVSWISEHNHFCNSLVDRIVPGRLTGPDLANTLGRLGYTDDLLIMSETFRLWAIECRHPHVREVLSFAKADEGVALAEDIEKFRELKLRLLNATHTISCASAILAGMSTVKESMADATISNFISDIALREIAPTIVSDKITLEDAQAFAMMVFDRFRNPYLEHQWLSIAAQYTSKMKMRVVPLLVSYHNKTGEIPKLMTLGFAAYLLLGKVSENESGHYVGSLNGETYVLKDDDAALIANLWEQNNSGTVVDMALANTDFWGADLAAIPQFAATVKQNLDSLVNKGFEETLKLYE